MPSEGQVIPITQSLPEKPNKKRIAAYCRVSTQADEQMHSLAAQRDFYEKSLSDDPDGASRSSTVHQLHDGQGWKKHCNLNCEGEWQEN